MIQPTYANAQCHKLPSVHVIIASGSRTPQGDPLAFKYFWRVFSVRSAWEGDEFWQNAPVFSLFSFEQEIRRLLSEDITCLLYGFRQPRRNAPIPLNLINPRWASRQFAVSYDDDLDPIMDGGHR